MNITTGKIKKAQRIVIYGSEGIGKSTFASKFPKPLFIDTEGSTEHLDVARTPVPTSWTMLKQLLGQIAKDPMGYKTIVIDTADWAERLCITEICAKGDGKGVKNGLEDFGYGKGYTYLAEEFGRLLDFLNEMKEQGLNIVFLAHCMLKRFEQPDENGSYDRYELKLEKKTSPLLKEWADMVLFANYKTIVTEIEGKKKASGGQRVMYTSHRPSWDAKNRHNLKDELLFEFSQIAHCIPVFEKSKEPEKDEIPMEFSKEKQESIKQKEEIKQEVKATLKEDKTAFNTKLYDLMEMHKVTEKEIQRAVSGKGYYPLQTPIHNYDESFVEGVLVGAWDQVFELIKKQRMEY